MGSCARAACSGQRSKMLPLALRTRTRSPMETFWVVEEQEEEEDEDEEDAQEGKQDRERRMGGACSGAEDGALAALEAMRRSTRRVILEA